MPDAPAPVAHAAPGAKPDGDLLPATPEEADAHAEHAFDITSAMMHHNMPYPAMEWVHGRPFIVFDRGLYAAINYDLLAHQPGFEEADPEPYLDWAQEIVDEGDFRYDPEELPVEGVAKAMALVDDLPWNVAVFPRPLAWFNQQLFFGTLALLLLTLLLTVAYRRRPDQLRPANRVQHALEALTLYLRDEVVRPAIPHHPERWTGFLVAMFLMILVVNIFGLIPGTGTMSGNIGVTAGFATVTLFCMLFFGMREQGPRFWVNIVPIRLTLAMAPVWLLLLLIELMGLLIKPFALAVRLFANMFAGHTVLLVFLSLGYVIVAQMQGAAALALTFQGAGFFLAIAFHAMELLVAFIQAYVFTMLSAMFIGMSIHPEH